MDASETLKLRGHRSFLAMNHDADRRSRHWAAVGIAVPLLSAKML
jgi:hypothetical protein